MKKTVFVLFAVFCMASCKKEVNESFYATYDKVFINEKTGTSVVCRPHLNKPDEKYISDKKEIKEKLKKAVEAKSKLIVISVFDDKIIKVEMQQ